MPGALRAAAADRRPLRAERRPGRLHQRAEALGVARRDVGQGLAVQLHARPLEPGHELAVAHVVRPRRRVDAHDPQAAEVALLALAADVREVAGAVDRLLRGPVELALVEEVALGQAKDLLAPLAALVPT